MKKILIVEDNVDINNLLTRILSAAKYEVASAFSGSEAKLYLESKTPDIILLDLMLPGISGEELLLDIRQNKQLSVPVLIISAKDALEDKVYLLKNGADDYITKPFEPDEVLARIEVAMRHYQPKSNANKPLTYKNIQLHPSARKVLVNEIEVALTAREYDLLYLLLQNPEKVYSRESLYELVWQGGYYGENNTVNVHMSNLRKKLKEIDDSWEYIQTVYGIGFKLQD